MKIIIAFVSLMFVLTLSVSAISSKNYISVKVNDNLIKMNSLPILSEGSTYVPLKFLNQALKLKAKWVGKTKKATISDANIKLEMIAENNEILANGNKMVIDQSLKLIKNVPYVPIRFVAKQFGYALEWDKKTLSILLNKDNVKVPKTRVLSRKYSDEDIIWLSRIVEVEAYDLSVDAKLAVANIILNRVKADDFPKTIFDVIFDKKYCVQFPPAHKPQFKELVPTENSVIVAKMALEGINNIDRCLFFNDTPFKNKSKDLFVKIDDMYFYF